MFIFNVFNNFTDCKYLFERISFYIGPITLIKKTSFIRHLNSRNYSPNNRVDRALREVYSREIYLLLINDENFSVNEKISLL